MDIRFASTKKDYDDIDLAIEELDLPREKRTAPKLVWILVNPKVAGCWATFTVVDNRDSEAFTEDFATLDGALLYATDVHTTCEHQEDWDYMGAFKDSIDEDTGVVRDEDGNFIMGKDPEWNSTITLLTEPLKS